MTPTPPLWVIVLGGAVLGLVAGVILASAYLTFALGLDPMTFDMLTVFKLSAPERLLYAEDLRLAHGGIGLITLTVPAIGLLAQMKRRLTTYGDAHWQDRREMARSGMIGRPGSGFVCAKLGDPRRSAPYVVAQDRPHVMMIAPTRAGKGVGFVIPNLLTFEGSAVTLDVKGELFESTARWRGREQRPVHRFAPFDWENPGVRYNPLEAIAALSDIEQRYTRIEKLANLFLDRDNRQNSTFSEAGQSIFVAACMLALQRGTPTLGAVREIVLEGHDKKRQYRRYAAEAAEGGDDTSRLLWTEAASTSDKLLTSNIQALMTGGFKAWNNPAVRRATEASDFDFTTFRSEPQSLYLCIDEDDIKALSPLLRMIFSDLIATLRAHEPGPDEPHAVMLMMDEFQQMGAMPYLEGAIHTLASYGGRVAIIAQSLASLDRIYGPEGRESFEAGSALKLYIQPREQRTVAEVSRAVGSCTAEGVTRSYGAWRGLGGLRGQSVREEERPLLSETAARTMDPDDVIVLAAPLMPIRARRIKHYEDPTFMALMKAQEAMPWPPSKRRPEGPSPAGGPSGAPPSPASPSMPAPEPAAAAAAAAAAPSSPAGVVSEPSSSPTVVVAQAQAGSVATPSSRHGARVVFTDQTPRNAGASADVIAHVRRLEAQIIALTAEMAALREGRSSRGRGRGSTSKPAPAAREGASRAPRTSSPAGPAPAAGKTGPSSGESGGSVRSKRRMPI